MPSYFPPSYFGSGYWGGEQIEGSMSASLGGGGTITAELTSIGLASVGGRKRRSNYSHLDAKIKPVNQKVTPAFIEARIGGASGFAAGIFATADIETKITSGGNLGASPSAIAYVQADMSGASATEFDGLAVDNWALARDEDEIWLLAA
jgi:hypothetical protein